MNEKFSIRTGGKNEEIGRSISAVVLTPASIGHSPVVNKSQPSGNLPGHGAKIPLIKPDNFESISSESLSVWIFFKCKIFERTIIRRVFHGVVKSILLNSSIKSSVTLISKQSTPIKLYRFSDGFD